MTTTQLWTVWLAVPGQRRRMVCQYGDRARADRHCEDLRYCEVSLATANPRRVVEDSRGRRRKVGVPQYV